MTQQTVNPHVQLAEPEILEQYIARQGRNEFVRTLSNQMESVSYQPDSTIRLWYNDAMTVYEPHWHSAAEMIVPVEGNYPVTVRQQTYELAPGDIFLIPGGEPHALHPSAPGARFIFLFELDPVWSIRGSSYLSTCLSRPVLINRTTCPSIYNEEMEIVAQLSRDYLHEDGLRDVTMYAKLLHFLLNYGRDRLAAESGGGHALLSHPGMKNYAEKFNAVFAYIDRNYAEDLTLENVASVAGFSKFHFSRTFKQLSGYNFYDYLCSRRIKASEMLLMRPGLSISQIALQSGFSSVSTFNRTFKKLKGCTPTQYRGMFQVHIE